MKISHQFPEDYVMEVRTVNAPDGWTTEVLYNDGAVNGHQKIKGYPAATWTNIGFSIREGAADTIMRRNLDTGRLEAIKLPGDVTDEKPPY